MGQAIRKAIGQSQQSYSGPLVKPKTKVHPRSSEFPKRPTVASEPDASSRSKSEPLLEQRNSEYEAMLKMMSGRVTKKTAGTPEMGEVSFVEHPKRPLPRARDTKTSSAWDERREVPPGTLNVATLRHILLLHQGKAEGQTSPMDAKGISEMLRLDIVHVQRILVSLSLPPEQDKKKSDLD